MRTSFPDRAASANRWWRRGSYTVARERSPGENFCYARFFDARLAPASAPRKSTRGARKGCAKTCECCPACVQTALGVHPDVAHCAPEGRECTMVPIEQVREMHGAARPEAITSADALRLHDAETLNVPAQNASSKTLDTPARSFSRSRPASARCSIQCVRGFVRCASPAHPGIEEIVVARGNIDKTLTRGAPRARQCGARARAHRWR